MFLEDWRSLEALVMKFLLAVLEDHPIEFGHLEGIP